MAGLAAGLGVLGLLPGSPAAGRAQDVQSGPTYRIMARTATIETLPVVVATAFGDDRRIGISVEFDDTGSRNPLDSFRGPAVAALATTVDALQTKRVVIDAYNYFSRAPVALTVRTSVLRDGLTNPVITGPAENSLPALLAGAVQPLGPSVRTIPAENKGVSPLLTFAVRQVDGLVAYAPLPQYAALAGGTLVWDASQDPTLAPIGAGSLFMLMGQDPTVRDPLVELLRSGSNTLRDRSAEDIVDAIADRYPAWEPDAVLEAVRAAQRSLNPTGVTGREALDHAVRLTGIELTASRVSLLSGSSSLVPG